MYQGVYRDDILCCTLYSSIPILCTEYTCTGLLCSIVQCTVVYYEYMYHVYTRSPVLHCCTVLHSVQQCTMSICTMYIPDLHIRLLYSKVQFTVVYYYHMCNKCLTPIVLFSLYQSRYNHVFSCIYQSRYNSLSDSMLSTDNVIA